MSERPRSVHRSNLHQQWSGKSCWSEERGLQTELVTYIVEVKNGEKDKDWYELFENDDLFDVVRCVKLLDEKAIVYKVDLGFGWGYILVNCVNVVG